MRQRREIKDLLDKEWIEDKIMRWERRDVLKEVKILDPIDVRSIDERV